MRAIINAMTRMRMCTADGDMEFKHKREPADGPGLVPWFDVPDRVAPDVQVVFGHWSGLGLLVRTDVICLDTGCVWGGQRTGYSVADREMTQMISEQRKGP